MSFRIFAATPFLLLATVFLYLCVWEAEDWWQVVMWLILAAEFFSIGLPLLVGGIRKSWDGAK